MTFPVSFMEVHSIFYLSFFFPFWLIFPDLAEFRLRSTSSTYIYSTILPIMRYLIQSFL